jgi:hypothetical protein
MSVFKYHAFIYFPAASTVIRNTDHLKPAHYRRHRLSRSELSFQNIILQDIRSNSIPRGFFLL